MKTYQLIKFVICLVISGSIYSQVDPGTENLTHAWTFDNGTANDIIGTAHGTLMGSAAIKNGELVIADSGQYLQLPADVIAINTYNELSVEAWFTVDKDANTGLKLLFLFGSIITTDFRDLDGCYFFEALSIDDKSRAVISNSIPITPFGSTKFTVPWLYLNCVESKSLNDNNLHHLVSTVDSTKISLFIDGIFIGADTFLVPNLISIIGSDYASLGKSGKDDGESLIGSIDEFKIYNKVLSVEEVDFLYKNHFVSVDHIKFSDNEITVFPNPVSDQFTISFKKPHSGYFINIINMTGVQIYSKFVKSNETLIDIDPIHKNEIYNVVIISSNHKVLATKRILIHRK